MPRDPAPMPEPALWTSAARRRRAVFLDRDDTLIVDPGYLRDPEQVALLPGVGAAIRRLNDAGYFVAVVTNQSGIARGRFTERELADVHDRLRERLAEHGARLDAIYYCPYLAGNEATVRRFRKESPERKPAPGMLLRAAADHALDLARSWMVGDRRRDVDAGRRAGCRTVLLAAEKHVDGESQPDFICADLGQAVDRILESGDKPLNEAGSSKSGDVGQSGDAGTVDTMAREGFCVGPESGASQESGQGLPRRETLGTAESASSADSSDVLTEIRDILRRQERRERQEDFSVVRLLGTLAQMLALAMAGWGVAAIFGTGEGAAARLLLAVFLQVLALTAVAAGRR